MSISSRTTCCDIKKIEVDFSGNEKKILVNGKELDLRKICGMEITIGAGIIRLDATLNELPTKE